MDLQKLDWPPAQLDEWNGFKGWILWPSLAALLADCVISFVWVFLEHPIVSLLRVMRTSPSVAECAASPEQSDPESHDTANPRRASEGVNIISTNSAEIRGPTGLGMSSKAVGVCLALAISFSVVLVKLPIGKFTTWFQLIIAVLLALPLSIAAIQAMGQTGVNPVSALGTSPCNQRCIQKQTNAIQGR